MPSEKRTRVEIFLPIRSDAAAYHVVTEWLAEELAYARGGATLTTPFTGLYTSSAQFGIRGFKLEVQLGDLKLIWMLIMRNTTQN